MARFKTSNVLHCNKPQNRVFLVCQKTKILHRIKFNQAILTKLLKRMHQLSINLLCSFDYQTAYSFCEIKHFFKQAKSLLIHFQGLLLKNVTCFITSFLVLRVLFMDLVYRLWKRRYEPFYQSRYLPDWFQPDLSWLFDLNPISAGLFLAFYDSGGRGRIPPPSGKQCSR